MIEKEPLNAPIEGFAEELANSQEPSKLITLPLLEIAYQLRRLVELKKFELGLESDWEELEEAERENEEEQEEED